MKLIWEIWDYIYISTNAGVNWAQSATINDWLALAVSTNGIKMYATTPDGIYISTNTGSTWNFSAASPAFSYSLVCSADGNQVFAGLEGGSHSDSSTLGIYASTNGGATWSQTSAPIDQVQNYQYLSMSTYGDILMAGAYSSENNGLIYLSTDGGADWVPQTAPTNSWGCVFCSGDGSLLTAGEYGGSIYSANNPPITNLGIKVAANKSILSWPLFPAGFVPQSTGSLNPPVNWTNTASTIVQLGTNYYTTNELAAPGGFFRLVRP